MLRVKSNRTVCIFLYPFLSDAIVTESSDEEAEYGKLSSTRPADDKMPSTRPLDTEKTPSIRPLNAEKMPSITEGRITRAKARELAREVKAMINEEVRGGDAARDFYNIFQATEEGKGCAPFLFPSAKNLIKNVKSFVSFGFEKKSPPLIPRRNPITTASLASPEIFYPLVSHP
ncbi:unnamed protein product [Cochlearia groenlandica]